MLPHLRLRKTHRRLIPNRKGFSSIIGAVFAALIMISLISTVFVWSLSQNTLYNNTVKLSNQADLDRSNEKVMTDVNITRVTDNLVRVNGTVENYGSLSVQIITLWVADASNENYTYVPLDIALPPGGRTSLDVNVALANSEYDSLGCWFISARGNTIFEKSFSPTYIQNTVIDNRTDVPMAWIAQGIGAFAFDFTSFRVYNASANKLVYPGVQTSSVAWGSTIAFSFNVTNLYPTKQSIILNGNVAMGTACEMWSYFPVPAGQATGPIWYLSNVDPTTKTVSTSYTPITLVYNQTQELFFARQSAKPTWDSQTANRLGAINLLMYGTFTGSPPTPYAQNIPFISLYAYA